MKESNDPWGMIARVKQSLKMMEVTVGILENNARMIQPMITGPSLKEALSALSGRPYPSVLKDMCSMERETGRKFIREPVEDLFQLLKDPKFFLVCPQAALDELWEIVLCAEMLDGRIDRAERVFNLADQKIFDFALAIAAKR